MPACFAVIDSIASTTQKFVSMVNVQAIGILSLNWKKLEIPIEDFKIFTKDKVSTDTIF